MPQYVLLLFAPQGEVSEEESQAEFPEWIALMQQMNAANVHRAGEALDEASTATCLTVRDGERVVTDGPFIETKEQIVGFYLLEVDDLDAALDWAAKVPTARHGTVEVRPIWDWRTMVPEGVDIESQPAG